MRRNQVADVAGVFCRAAVGARFDMHRQHGRGVAGEGLDRDPGSDLERCLDGDRRLRGAGDWRCLMSPNRDMRHSDLQASIVRREASQAVRVEQR